MIVLAVDGGNSKTDLALVDADGTLIAHARGPLSSPHHLGLDGCARRAAAARRRGGARRPPRRRRAGRCSPGVDFPDEEERLHAALDARGWADAHQRRQRHVRRAARRAPRAGWGIAITCGAGINCVGVGPGRHAMCASPRSARSPATGAAATTWASPALSAAARSEDGRGPKTRARAARARALRLREPARARAGDARRRASPSAGSSSSRPSCSRGRATRSPRRDRRPAGRRGRRARARGVHAARARRTSTVEVLVGGGLMRGADSRLLGRIETGLRSVGPRLVLRRTSAPPIVGAALLGLDAVGAGRDAQDAASRGAERGGRNDSRRWRWVDGRACATTRRRGSTPARTHRPSTRSTWRSPTASSWCWSARPGSGKTTALRMLAGLEEVDAGEDLHRRPRRHRPAAEAARRRDGLPELRALSVSHGRGEHRVPAADRARAEGGARARVARGRASCSASSRTSSAGPASSPAANASGSRWGARSSASRASS